MTPERFRGGGQKIGTTKLSNMSATRLLNLADGDVAQQVIDRGVHDLGEGLRIQAHPRVPRPAGSRMKNSGLLMSVEFRHMVVGRRRRRHPLVHPQVVGGAIIIVVAGKPTRS